MVYLYFIWTMFSRMQGPKDENIGKSREQMSLDSYGSLTFDDVAGQVIQFLCNVKMTT